MVKFMERGVGVDCIAFWLLLCQFQTDRQRDAKADERGTGLDDENRAHIFASIDAVIKAAKLKSIVDTKKPNPIKIGYCLSKERLPPFLF